jgi:hypothetical protein
MMLMIWRKRWTRQDGHDCQMVAKLFADTMRFWLSFAGIYKRCYKGSRRYMSIRRLAVSGVDDGR